MLNKEMLLTGSEKTKVLTENNLVVKTGRRPTEILITDANGNVYSANGVPGDSHTWSVVFPISIDLGVRGNPAVNVIDNAKITYPEIYKAVVVPIDPSKPTVLTMSW